MYYHVWSLSESIMKQTISSVAVLVALSTISYGTTIWHEGDGGQGDAGSLPGTANITAGSGGPLTDIIGSLSNQNTGSDMYEIMITSPSAFSATVTGNGNNPIVNSALYLFDSTGTGLFGNDNISATSSLSSLPVGTTTLLAPGLYYILLTVSGRLPAHGATDLFGDLTNTTAVAAASSLLKINGYNTTILTPSPADSGKGYDIVLTGASFAETPEPASIALIGSGLLLLGTWKRLQIN
jgi:hypothetical protein